MFFDKLLQSLHSIKLDNELVLELNKSNQAATIVDTIECKGDVYIPSSIKYKSKKYEINNTYKKSFYGCIINELTFSPDSQIKEIDISFSNIKSISLPNYIKIIKFNEHRIEYLSRNFFFKAYQKSFIYIDEENKLIAANYKENHYKLCCLNFSYNDRNEDQFDNLFCAKYDINQAVIPSFIKYIDDFCFFRCNNLQTIEFKEPSSLISIGDNAFNNSSIEYFTIPSQVQELKPKWLINAYNLKKVYVSSDNKYIKQLDSNQKILIGRKNIEQDDYYLLYFANRDIKSAIIPSSIEVITSCAFSNSSIEYIIFEKTSKLKVIQANAFQGSKLKSISIPDSVYEIEKNAFDSCSSLKTVSFSNNSNLQLIEDSAFYSTAINSIIIPPKVKIIHFNAFISCKNLISIEFLSDSIVINAIYDLCTWYMSVISFPNAEKISYTDMFIKKQYPNELKLYVKPHSTFEKIHG